MILITGGAGFIGSNLVASLNRSGIKDIAIYDEFGFDGKWKNLVKYPVTIWPHRPDFDRDGAIFECAVTTAIVHCGAVTDTQATDADEVLGTNYHWPVRLLHHATAAKIPFIYMSSASVYGNLGSSEDINKCQPLSLYAWSKHLFDQHVTRQLETAKSQIVGLRLFNVYGPNEYHKKTMASLLCQRYDEIMGGRTTLYRDLEATVPITRDFVYVDAVVATIRWFLERRQISGIFNVGTGNTCSFERMFNVANPRVQFDYVPIPESPRPTYQFCTQADIMPLRKAGCDVIFRPVEEGVREYVDKYLSQADRYR